MKKKYIKPLVEVERFELNTSIALNCGIIVKNGPEDPMLNKDACDFFKDDFGGDWDTFSLRGTSFYESGGGMTACDCYYTSGNEGYFTS